MPGGPPPNKGMKLSVRYASRSLCQTFCGIDALKVLGMKPGISEFYYGFALTSEVLSHLFPEGARRAPEFPSLYAEGRPGGGWDVRFPAV